LNKLIALALLFVVLMASWVYWLRPIDSSHYRLTVHNNTATTIDMIRVFGSGANEAPELKQLEPGQSGTLNLGLRPAGQLRFEVMRGYNRIDAIFEDDVSSLKRHQQWLIINKNNHFVFSDSAPE
jgi:hypothetical protein